LFNRRFGRFWAINAFLMHWGILFVMRITFTYQLSGVMFAPFFEVERLADRVRKLGWKLLRGNETDAEKPAPDSRPITKPLPGVPRATLYYDGECGLCDRFVQFVLRRDRREYFQFAPLQSTAGREQLARLGLGDSDLKTMVLVEGDKSFLRSTAALRVCRRLKGLWPLLYGFVLMPKGWRDQAYVVVARNRKRWFKARSECPIMPPEWRRRFIS
jgi:predicted DCC family thiol-disulfide oxidoreductase YuxK